MAEENTFSVTVEHLQGYEFKVGFDLKGVPPLALDEPEPLGESKGPNASRVLAAAVANCLSASLLYCLQRSRITPEDMKTTAVGTIERNDHGRLRVVRIDVAIDLKGMGEAGPRFDRCSGLFEDFCVVTASVRNGLPVKVTVRSDGEIVHTSSGE
ncbi:MAG: OsmC family protein [Acidobacteriota bacterium]|jgi:organic hydroperoxide reductase OsmC/OhrA